MYHSHQSQVRTRPIYNYRHPATSLSASDVSSQNERISVIGLGLMGSLLSVSFANNGHKVIAVDMDSRKVNGINQNHSPIQDAELEEAIVSARSKRNLVATSDLHNAILQTEVTLVCIGKVDAQESTVAKNIETVCQQIGATLAIKGHYHLIVIHSDLKSTCTEKHLKPILEKWSNKRCGKDFGLCYLPLHVAHKSQYSTAKLNEGILQGTHDNKSANAASRLFSTLDIGLKNVGVTAKLHSD
ncbi:NAD(P)-binding domain-containing protein [Aliiglaciecola sp. 3_MG-2023]|uniref:NAD(P)-binding domain-containing protein n=1 Tax=Aliiglaciecola sp. 3_MG-2023 TaxID=3062644 RepID=UPI0026E44293|nr:NAD(P)-binding domain-containing protein [Aliiglaciecola sp. 3_MG-2023]MDO6695344.1 NAD(P)-binding domain-containing protein [Aliiglaciecola sp. 3_MG-2023]